MTDRVEYWWVSYNAETQPAEVTFRGGIPVYVRLIGSRDLIGAASIEVLDRLPPAPQPVFQMTAAPPPPTSQSTSPLWLIGIIALILVTWFSGQIFDLIK